MRRSRSAFITTETELKASAAFLALGRAAFPALGASVILAAAPLSRRAFEVS